jgi:hypothetical protein
MKNPKEAIRSHSNAHESTAMDQLLNLLGERIALKHLSRCGVRDNEDLTNIDAIESIESVNRDNIDEFS